VGTVRSLPVSGLASPTLGPDPDARQSGPAEAPRPPETQSRPLPNAYVEPRSIPVPGAEMRRQDPAAPRDKTHHAKHHRASPGTAVSLDPHRRCGKKDPSRAPVHSNDGPRRAVRFQP